MKGHIKKAFDVVDNFKKDARGVESFATLYREYLSVCDEEYLDKRAFRKIISLGLKKRVIKDIECYSRDLTSIYFITDYDYKYVKIGKSDHPRDRLKELQTGSPIRLQVSYIFRNVGPMIEYQLHRLFSKYNIHNEWFNFNDDIKLVASKYNNSTSVTIYDILDDLNVKDRDFIIYGNIEEKYR
jgi:hypothetical protein